MPAKNARVMFWPAALLTSFGEFVDGYDLAVVGAAILYLKPAFNLTPAVVGLLSASSLLGAAIALLFFGSLTDRWGRRTIFMFNLVVFVGFAILSSLVTNVTELFVARFFIGFAVGLDIPPTTAYLAEIAPAKTRGRFSGGLPNVLWILGFITSALIGLALSGVGLSAWRWMFGLAAIPAAIVLIGRQFIPESPRWLVNHGDLDGAQRASLMLGIEVPLQIETSHKTLHREIFSSVLRKPALLAALVAVLNGIAAPAITYAVPYILAYGGLFSTKMSLQFSFVVYVADLLGVLASFAFMDRISRRKWGYISGGGSALLYGLFGLFGFGLGGLSSLLYLLAAFFVATSAVLIWTFPTELFPTRLRGTAQGFCNGAYRAIQVAIVFSIPIGIQYVGVQYVIGLFAIPFVAQICVFAFSRIFETQGKTLEQITANV
ncbi:MAG: MFS transporter [Nitrososphaerota archaeon]|nr:MFS transporter [Nitrososphaerota archaeon]